MRGWMLNVFRLFVMTGVLQTYLSHHSNYFMKTTPELFLWPLTHLIPLSLLFSGNFPRSVNRSFTRRETQLNRRLGSPSLRILIILPCILSRTRMRTSVAAATRSGSADVRWLLQGHWCGLRVRWCVLLLPGMRTKWLSPLLFASLLCLLYVEMFFFPFIFCFNNVRDRWGIFPNVTVQRITGLSRCRCWI